MAAEHYQEPDAARALLVFNCHEAWVYQLAVMGRPLDIIVGLKGQHQATWDAQMRPLPPTSRLVSLSDAVGSTSIYHCIIAHNIADLLDVKFRREPKLMVIHSTLEGRLLEEKSDVDAAQMKQMLHKYLDLIGAHAVAVSILKGNSWGFSDDIVPFCTDTADYLPHSGEIPAGLRICNFVSSRKRILLWDFHEEAFGDLPVLIVGHNPSMAEVSAARDWPHLKQLLRSHRFYIHTADPKLEDGYNMATVEAMAAAMPIVGNKHPGSPIKHGVSGFLSDDPHELQSYAKILLEDPDLARRMGQEAQKTAIERFSTSNFKSAFQKSIQTARQKAQATIMNQ